MRSTVFQKREIATLSDTEEDLSDYLLLAHRSSINITSQINLNPKSLLCGQCAICSSSRHLKKRCTEEPQTNILANHPPSVHLLRNDRTSEKSIKFSPTRTPSINSLPSEIESQNPSVEKRRSIIQRGESLC